MQFRGMEFFREIFDACANKKTRQRVVVQFHRLDGLDFVDADCVNCLP